MKREDVIRILHEQQKELVERYQIVSLSLFGSLARDGKSSERKIGILVKFARPTGFFQFLELKNLLQNLLNCEVDLGKTHSIRPELRNMILQEAIRVF